MPDLANSRKGLEISFDQVASDVEAQRALIATMRFDDPRLQSAFALLRQLEQRLTLAELDCVFIRINAERLSV